MAMMAFALSVSLIASAYVVRTYPSEDMDGDFDEEDRDGAGDIFPMS